MADLDCMTAEQLLEASDYPMRKQVEIMEKPLEDEK